MSGVFVEAALRPEALYKWIKKVMWRNKRKDIEKTF
jgi:hypothetical protein